LHLPETIVEEKTANKKLWRLACDFALPLMSFGTLSMKNVAE
jgi:hypothetical protein